MGREAAVGAGVGVPFLLALLGAVAMWWAKSRQLSRLERDMTRSGREIDVDELEEIDVDLRRGPHEMAVKRALYEIDGGGFLQSHEVEGSGVDRPSDLRTSSTS